jgi:hypothetical protein
LICFPNQKRALLHCPVPTVVLIRYRTRKGYSGRGRKGGFSDGSASNDGGSLVGEARQMMLCWSQTARMPCHRAAPEIATAGAGVLGRDDCNDPRLANKRGYCSLGRSGSRDARGLGMWRFRFRPTSCVIFVEGRIVADGRGKLFDLARLRDKGQLVQKLKNRGFCRRV